LAWLPLLFQVSREWLVDLRIFARETSEGQGCSSEACRVGANLMPRKKKQVNDTEAKREIQMAEAMKAEALRHEAAVARMLKLRELRLKKQEEDDKGERT
jgi:hypothetical protein